MSSPTRPRSSSHRRAARSAKKHDHSQLIYDEPIPGGAEVDTQFTIPAGRPNRSQRADQPPQPQQQAEQISPVQFGTAGESTKQLRKKSQRSRGTAAAAAEEGVKHKMPLAGAGEEVDTDEEGATDVRRVKVASAAAVEARRGRKRTGTATAAAPAPGKSSLQQQKQKLPFEGLAGSHQAGGGDADLKGDGQEAGEKGTAAVDPPAKRARGPAAKRPGRSGAATGASTSRSGPSREMETQLLAKGYVAVGGADEAGRGPLAGPVVAAVVVLPPENDRSWSPLHGLNDSKAMTEEEREAVYEQLTTDPRVKWAVSVVDHEEIDRINILQAALGAMRQSAVQLLQQQQQEQEPVLDFLLVDGNRMPRDLPVPGQPVVKGDAKVSCIAAASCIAKVTRDRLMLKLDEQYPQYGFAQHKGYGVPAHMEAIRKYGPSAVHRKSFEPVKSMTGWNREAALAAAAAAAVAANPQQNAAVGGEDGAEPAAVNDEPSKVVRGRWGRPSKKEREGEGGGRGRGGAPGGTKAPSPPRATSRRGRPRRPR
ncbi:hypothetical protein Vafri_20805 [Volvox africanus]|uniref:Ribonuclease n=1 Tax=Volvox africanus TaxID=51714 RepID=A0A8J4BRJ1_9CHLO|nr:hypothetical protein Vafri_20805 [Volvox africanus]